MSNNQNQNHNRYANMEFAEYSDSDVDEEQEHGETRIWCSTCHRLIQSSLYPSHIQEHIRNDHDISASIEYLTGTALLPLYDDLVRFPIITTLPPFTYSTSFHQPSSHNLQGMSFSNVFSLASTIQYTILHNGLYDGYDGLDEYDEYEANLRLAEVLGKVDVGVSDIDKVSKIVKKDTLSDDTTCPVCMENIKEAENITDCRELVCKHIYCNDCIVKWLKTNKRCPVCNLDIDELAQENNPI